MLFFQALSIFYGTQFSSSLAHIAQKLPGSDHKHAVTPASERSQTVTAAAHSPRSSPGILPSEHRQGVQITLPLLSRPFSSECQRPQHAQLSLPPQRVFAQADKYRGLTITPGCSAHSPCALISPRKDHSTATRAKPAQPHRTSEPGEKAQCQRRIFNLEALNKMLKKSKLSLELCSWEKNGHHQLIFEGGAFGSRRLQHQEGLQAPSDQRARLCRHRPRPHHGGSSTAGVVGHHGGKARGAPREAQQAHDGPGLLRREDRRRFCFSPTVGTSQCPPGEAHSPPDGAPAWRFHSKPGMKTTKSFAAEQMLLQPLWAETDEEEGEARATVSSEGPVTASEVSPGQRVSRADILPSPSPTFAAGGSSGGGARRRR
ncbi:uncharacterized protein LOC128854193 isoform X2 [Cuculus canorus]|uniref:uncharacterized protein LOC128854193 isoform X2 n=1 Tax=Cuculus canorus TaxID=55661 RepID=UPI0023AABCF7|nr:uncharacterized protein LOC128854193 isoform X2 [Cuculus canorus]